MYARLTYLICFVLALALAGNVQGQTATWTDATEDHDWFTVDNWSEFPTLAHWTKVRTGGPGPTILNEGAVALKVSIGYEEGSVLTVESGSLTTAEYLQMGRNDGSGTLNVMGGAINVGRDLEVGYDAPGTLNMTGGTIDVGRDFTIPDKTPLTGHVNLNGGTIIVRNDFIMRDDGTLDITAGTLILDSNVVPIVQGYIDNGWMTAYDGHGTIQLDYDVTNEGQTTVTALHKLAPYPADAGIAAPGQVELSWTLPDPCTPGLAVLVDVYFTDDLEALQSFSDPASMQIVTQGNVTSATVQTVAKTRYYWAVDTYLGGDDPNNNPLWGPIFSFLADNNPPEVEAGEDVLTWLDNGSVEVALAGAVIDAGPTSTVWTVVSEPNDPNSPLAVIADAAALDTTVTLSAVGEYVLQLQADDGEYQGTDTLTIDVYRDQCAAAQSQPDWQPLPGDINLDCVVDQTDLDILLEQWLNCNGLDCPDIDPVDPNLPE